MEVRTCDENGFARKTTSQRSPPDRIIKNIQDGMSDDSWNQGLGPPGQDSQQDAGKENMWKYGQCPAMGQMNQGKYERCDDDCFPGPVFFLEAHLHIAPESCFFANTCYY